MKALPSGSVKNAMWQTPESIVSARNSMPRDSSSVRAASTSSTWSAIGWLFGRYSMPSFFESTRATVRLPVSNSAPIGSSCPHSLERSRPSTFSYHSREAARSSVATQTKSTPETRLGMLCPPYEGRLAPVSSPIVAPRHIDELDTPSLVVDLDVFERNVRTGMERLSGVAVRPHQKTAKSPAVARRLLEAGARGICVAKLSEAEVMLAAGIDDVLITTELAGELKARRLAR